MTIETKEKATRTPRDYSSIEKGALALELKDRVELRKNLEISIDAELRKLKETLAQAEQIVNGKS